MQRWLGYWVEGNRGSGWWWERGGWVHGHSTIIGDAGVVDVTQAVWLRMGWGRNKEKSPRKQRDRAYLWVAIVIIVIKRKVIKRMLMGQHPKCGTPFSHFMSVIFMLLTETAPGAETAFWLRSVCTLRVGMQSIPLILREHDNNVFSSWFFDSF